MSLRSRILIAAIVGLGALIAVVVWWVVGSSEEAVNQDAAEQLAQDLGGEAASADEAVTAEASEAPLTDVNGTWTVTGQDIEDVSDGSFVGFRINEVLSGLANTVTGRTADVIGEITIVDGALTSGSFEVRMASLRTDQSQRDAQLRTRGLEYETFPTSTFAVTEAVAIDSGAALNGDPQVISVSGELTLHGVTRAVRLDVSASLVGTTLAVTGSTDIALADYDIDKPTGLRVADIDDAGVMEFQLFLSRS